MRRKSNSFLAILFGANGGQFTPDTHLPIMHQEVGDFGIRARCSRPWDCGTCSLMRKWIEARQAQGWFSGWECSDCLKRTAKFDLGDGGGGRELPGFYQAGRRAYPPDDLNYDADRPGLLGCTRCGFETSFLQLVLRRTSY